MNLVRQMMPGHDQCEIPRSRMSEYTRICNEYFGLNMRGSVQAVNSHGNLSEDNQYPRRIVGHDLLPERTVVDGTTFYVRHCVYNFGTNSLSFYFALSEDNHDLFPSWDSDFIKNSLTYVFMSMLRNHTWFTGSFKISIRDHIRELSARGVKIHFDGYSATEMPALIGTHRVKSRRPLYRASFHLGPTFNIGKAPVSLFEL